MKDGKFYAIQGTKGHLWTLSDVAAEIPGDGIDMSYFDRLVEEARADIEKLLPGSGFNSVDEFLA